MTIEEPINCGDCGKLIEANKSGVYACDCGWVGWTNERLSTLTERRRNSDIKRYRKNSPFTKGGMMKMDDEKKPVEVKSKIAKKGENGRKIMEFIRSDMSKTVWSPKDVADGLDMTYANAYGHIQGLIKNGELIKDPNTRGSVILPEGVGKSSADPVEEKKPEADVPEGLVRTEWKMIIQRDGGVGPFVDIEKVSFVGLICRDIDIGYRFDLIVDGIHVPAESKNRADLEEMRNIIMGALAKRFVSG